MVISAASERDRSVGRVAPVVDEVSLHTKPLSALAASSDFLFTGASPRPAPFLCAARLRAITTYANQHVVRHVAGCESNELKAWARPAMAEPPPITDGTEGIDDDRVVDVKSNPDSEERDGEQVAGAIPERRSAGVTADV